MSASPATGLIGLEENGYLRDFYACMGFLSLASQRLVPTSRRNVGSLNPRRSRPSYLGG